MADQNFLMPQWGFHNSNASGFQPQPDLQPSMEQDPHDIDMAQPDAAQYDNRASSPEPASVRPPSGRSRGPRSRYGPLDWDRHRKTLKKMYFCNTLPEIMRIMKEDHSFEAPEKLYKEKFKEWKWKKNLPAGHAQYMAVKGEKRKRDEKKDTVFLYGGTTWTVERAERTLSRVKKPRLSHNEIQDMRTPGSVSYKTPGAMVLSPVGAAEDEEEDPGPSSPPSVAEQQVILLDDSTDSSSSSSSSPSPGRSENEIGEGARSLTEVLPLRWKGLTRSDLLAVFDSAESHRKQGDHRVAENLFLQALEGLRFVVGPVHESSTKVSYALASFYAETDQMADADRIIEEVTELHLDKLGHTHQRTQQHVMHAVELLNGWNRPEDALGLVNRSKELLLEHENGHSQRLQDGNVGDLSPSSSDAEEGAMELADVSGLVEGDSSSRTIDFALGFARQRIATADEAVEGLLLLIMDQCKVNPSQLTVQHLKAKAELLRLYDNCDTVDDHAASFYNAESLFVDSWYGYNWDEQTQKFHSLEMIEAGMQLAASMLKAGYEVEAKDMFDRIVDKSRLVFGKEDERTVWTLISIGLVYQKYLTWERAEPWFEHALAYALSAFGARDGIVMALEHAQREQHFSYLNDEGRPFRTVFGVSGLTIRPLRLHLE